MPSIQNQHITPTALQNIQFLYFLYSLSLVEALQIQTRLRAQCTGAVVPQANKGRDMTVLRKGYRCEKWENGG